jgi:hypothetical protein
VWSVEKAGRLRARLGRAAYPALFALVVAGHLLLTFYYERPGLMFDVEPNSWLDFDTHIEQAWRVTEALDGWGRHWAYDVQMLAGYPTGTIFDADNKGWEIWTYALWKLGMPKGMAFNMFILLAHLIVPWMAYASARCFRLDRWASLTAMVLALAIWYFDAFPRWSWWIGMISWAIVGTLALLPVALMYRYLEDGRWWRPVVMAVVMGAGHMIHPYIFVPLALPMGAMYVRAFRKLPWTRHAALVAVAVFTIAVNSWWLLTALRFWRYILDSGYCFQGTLSYLVTDYLGLIGKDPLVSGVVGNRTGFRFLAIACTVLCLVSWRRSRDPRFLPFATSVAGLFAITYLGGYFWVTRQIQPYRFILPALFVIVIPAAAYLVDLVRSAELRSLPRKAYVLVGILVFLTLPHFARDVLYFMPALLPDLKPLPEGKSAPIADVVGFGDFGFPKHMEFRHGPHWPDFTALARWLEENDDGQGRVLVEWNVLGEHLAWRTHSQIVGGFHERNMAHSAANLFRLHPQADVTDEELVRYLTDYAIKWVIVTHRRPALDNRRHVLEPKQYIPHHRIYESKVGWSYFQENGGHVAPSMNRLAVTGTDPGRDVVLRFHFLGTLVCEPGCTILKEPVLGNSVGFMRIPAPHPADFEILNGYEWRKHP